MTPSERTPSRIPNPEARIPPLCAIVDQDAAARAGRNLVELADAYLRGGARFLQVRAKHATAAALLEAARAVVALARAHRAIVVVNDRADVARLSGADGVHVGQDDLPAAMARRLLGPTAIVGVSTHTPAQAEAAAAEPISYLAIGPVFATTTKDTPHQPLGLDGVREAAAAARARGLPLVAIGGITLATAAAVLRAGADSVAIIADLLATDDPEARVRALIEQLIRV